MASPRGASLLEHGAIDVRDRKSPIRQQVTKLLDGRFLDFRGKTKLTRKSLKIADFRPAGFHAGLVLQRAFLDERAVRRKHHAQTGQSARVTLLLPESWKLDTHSTAVFLPARPRFAARVPASSRGPSAP